jgi:alkaline phosphatase D
MKFLLLTLILFLYTNSGLCQNNLNISPELLPQLDKSLAPFYHGVASGDPTQNSVVIWSKITLDKTFSEAAVNWEIATDAAFEKNRQSGTITTSGDSDFTIKTKITTV